MYNAVRKTAPTVSAAVKEFLQENNACLETLSANLVQEKIFTDKREYVVELSSRSRDGSARPVPSFDEEVAYARSALEKLLDLMKFSGASVALLREDSSYILKISAGLKDGLIIGKNGQNLLALQYLISAALDKKFKRHIPVIIDVDSYREKRVAYLKSMARTMAEKARSENTEVITDFLPSYERKLIHEELTGGGLKTFSVGKGSYKKVVITSLL
jgi:spoIIIJ-associated protein